MKQDITTYLVDSFVDYKGDTHHIVACALSQSPKQDSHTLRVGWADKANRLDVDDHLFHEVYRMVTVGISICNPEDKFDEQEGIKIATRRVKNNPLGELKTPFITCLCKDQVEHILKGELNYIITNIDKFIER